MYQYEPCPEEGDDLAQVLLNQCPPKPKGKALLTGGAGPRIVLAPLHGAVARCQRRDAEPLNST